MSAHLDQKRLGGMIRAWLHQDNSDGKLDFIRKLAARFQHPEDALCAFLVGSLNPDEVNFRDAHMGDGYPMAPCTHAQFEFFMRLCKEIAGDFHIFSSQSSEQAWERLARVGRFPNEIPKTGSEGWAIEWYMEKDAWSFKSAWAWAWYKDREVREAFIQESTCPDWKPSDVAGSRAILWGFYTFYWSGLVDFPEDRFAQTVLALVSWFDLPDAEEIHTNMCDWFGDEFSLRDRSDEDLHLLSPKMAAAANVLGKRLVELRDPDSHSSRQRSDWATGVRMGLQSAALREGYEECASRFKQASHVEQVAIWQAFADQVTTGDDPFQERIHRLNRDTGCRWTNLQEVSFAQASEYFRGKQV